MGRPISSSAADVLVVDDDSAIRQLLTAILVEEGYAVRTAPDGRAALSRCAEQLPALMLLDLHMPEVDGFQVLAELDRRGWREFPILVVTGNSGLSALAGRVDGIVRKPIDIDALIARAYHLVASGIGSNQRGDPPIRGEE